MARSVLLVLLLASCGPLGPQEEVAPSFPADALLSATSQSGSLSLEVRTYPQPPTRGVLAVQLTVTNASGPVEGLSITSRPWMPNHGHGASVQPSISEQGGGVYLLTHVYLAMPGTWDLRLTLDGAMHDSATVSLQVP